LLAAAADENRRQIGKAYPVLWLLLADSYLMLWLSDSMPGVGGAQGRIKNGNSG
jgi:hypothetical protein